MSFCNIFSINHIDSFEKRLYCRLSYATFLSPSCLTIWNDSKKITLM